MISIPKFTINPLVMDTLIVGSVATKLYHTSCKEDEEHVVEVPVLLEPLKLPVVVTQLVLGVNVIALTHKSFCEYEKKVAEKATIKKYFIFINLIFFKNTIKRVT
jgi:hypothetical protein